MGVRNSKHGGEDVRAVRAGDLDDVPILGGLENHESIIAGRQYLGANARNLDGHGKGDYRVPRLIVGLCFRRHDKTKHNEAQCCSNSLETFHFSPRFLRPICTAVMMHSQDVVGFS
jgi:hypothetical protein